MPQAAVDLLAEATGGSGGTLLADPTSDSGERGAARNQTSHPMMSAVGGMPIGPRGLNHARNQSPCWMADTWSSNVRWHLVLLLGCVRFQRSRHGSRGYASHHEYDSPTPVGVVPGDSANEWTPGSDHGLHFANEKRAPLLFADSEPVNSTMSCWSDAMR